MQLKGGKGEEELFGSSTFFIYGQVYSEDSLQRITLFTGQYPESQHRIILDLLPANYQDDLHHCHFALMAARKVD